MKAVALPKLRMPRFGRAPQTVVVILVIGLVGAMAIEPTRQLLQQRDRISGMTGDLAEVQSSNTRLEDQIARLKNDDYIEQRAREQIGLVRPGETTYVVMPPSNSDEPKRKQRAEKPAPPPPPGFFESVLDFVGL
jgi:cell division protein FtsB